MTSYDSLSNVDSNLINAEANAEANADAVVSAVTATASITTTTTQTMSESSGELLTKIKATLAPHETHQVNLTPIVQLIENIFHNADAAFKATGVDSLDEYDGMTQVLADIHKISCEISCNHSGLEQLNKTLEGYHCSARVVLVVAAFALIFGEFWILVRLRDDDLFAKSLDLLRGYSQSQIPDFKDLDKLLTSLMNVVKTNFGFLKPPVCNISADYVEMKDAMAYFPEATNSIIQTVVELSSILGKKLDYDIGLTITKLVVEVTSINVALQAKYKLCKKVADKLENQQHEEIHFVFEKKEQIKIVAKFMGIDEQEVTRQNLKEKHVVFLISDIDQISIEEINSLSKLFEKNRKDNYEIIWLPISTELTYKRKMLTELESKMTIWRVVHPSKIASAVIRYIKTEWHFIKNTIAVTLNAQGEVTCPNILPTWQISGKAAFPLIADDDKDIQIWRNIDGQISWKLDFLITEQIDSDIWSLGNSGDQTFVCLFGGDTTSWIQEFIGKVKEVTKDAKVYLKLAYVGSCQRRALERKDLGHQDTQIQVLNSENRLLFWKRLESIFYSKIRQEKNSKTDPIMREVMKVLSYDGNGGEWAIFAMGSEVTVTANGETALEIMSKYKDWKGKGTSFLGGLRTYKDSMRSHIDCVHVNVPVVGHMPRTVICPECFKEMKMYYAYRCCGV